MTFDPTQPFEIVGRAPTPQRVIGRTVMDGAPQGEVEVAFDTPQAAAPAFDPAQPFEVVRSAAAPPETAGEAAMRIPGRAARMALQGVLQVPDMLNNAGAAVLNAPFVAYDALRGNAPGTSEPFRYGAIAGAGRRVADEAGLPQYPEGATGRVTGLIGEGMAGGAGVVPLARQGAAALTGTAQQVARAFSGSPGVDIVAGGVGGGAQGLAAEAGVGEVGQAGANLGGNFGTAIAAAIIAAVARRRAAAPRDSIMPTPEAVTPEEIAGVSEEVAQAYRAQGIPDAEIRQAIEAFQLAELQRQRAAPSVRDAQTAVAPRPEDMTPRMRQDFVERSAAPPVEMPRAPEQDVTPAPPQTYRMGPLEDPAVAYDARRAEMERAQFEAESAAVRAAQARQAELDLAAFQSVRPQEPPRAGPPPEAPPAPPEPAAGGDVPPVRPGPSVGRSDGAPGAAPDPVGSGVPGARNGGGAPSAATRAASPVELRAQQQIARLTRNGEPAPGSKAAAQLARLRAQVPPAEGAPRVADPQPASPDPAARPAEATTTPRPTSADVAPVNQVDSTQPAPVAPRVETPPAGQGTAETTGPRAEPGPGVATEPPARPADAPEQAGSARRPGGAPPPDAPAPGRSSRVESTRRDLADARRRAARVAKQVEADRRQIERRADESIARSKAFWDKSNAEAAERAAAWDGRLTRAYQEGQARGLEQRPLRGQEDLEPRGAPDLYSGVPLSPENIRRFLADPAMAAARRLKQTLLSSSGARAVGDTTRYWLASNRAALNTFADRYPNIPELRKLVDDIATDPGAGRRVGETYQTAADNTAMSFTNRVTNMLGKTPDEAADARVRDLLTGNGRPRDAAEAAKVQRVRALLDEFRDYMVKAGIDLGYVKGKYFPRLYDADKALANSKRFLDDASALYRRMGLDAGEARDAANDWLNRLAGVGKGPNEFGHSAIGGGRFTKARQLPPDADTIMREWLVTDPRETLHGYFLRGAKAAEFTRRFGKNGEKIEETLTAAFQKGMAPRDIDLFRRHIESSLGTMGGVASGSGHALSGWIQTIGPLAVLPRAAISSIVEGAAIGVRTGNLWRGLEGFAESWKAIARADSTAEARQTAELLGIISDGFADMRAAAMWDAGVNSKTQRALVGGMFRVTGLHEMTNGQRVAATKIGQVWIRQLLNEVADGAPTQASAKRLLTELGVDEAQVKPLRAWLARNNGVLKQTDLLGDAPEAATYRTAVRRFVNESIMNPEAVDKPALASHHVGRLAYGITSFMFAFTRNVVLRSIKEANEGLAGSGYSMADRARLVAPMMAFFALGAAQFGVSQVREMLFNWHQNDTRDPWVKSILNLDRAGAFGTFSPLVNMISAAKYDRDPSSVLTGPYLAHFMTNLGKMSLGLVPQPVGPNSPNTNNAEHTAVRAFHAAVLAPVISAGAAMAPGGAGLQAAYGIGTMFATSRGAGQELATAAVGPPTVKPRTPGQSSRGSQIRR